MTKLITLIGMFFLLAGNTFAAGLESLQIKELDKIAMAEYRDYNDATMIKLVYDGDEATANVSLSSAVMTIAAPTGTTIYTLDTTYAAYDTLGELCDYIEAQSDMKCSLTGGKRDDASTLLYDAVTTQSILASVGGYELKIGTSAVSGDTGSYMNRIGITPQSGRRVVLKYCNVDLNSTTSDTNGLIVYGKLRKFETLVDGVTRNDTTSVVSGIVILDDTATEVGNTNNGNWLEFAKDAHVVISAGSGTSTQASGNSLECFWDEK